MASIATFVNRFVGVGELAETKLETWARAESPRLRPIANEDVYLFVKRIDNSAIVRAADPVARRARTGSVVTGFAAAMLVIAGLAPTAYNTMAGFALQNLQQESERLQKEKTTLDRQQAELLSTTRLERLATSLQMTAPGPQDIRYVEGKATSEARNAMPDANSAASAR